MSEKTYPTLEAWFVTGSQHLYGEEALAQVAVDARAIAEALDRSDALPLHVVFKPVVTTPDAIHQLCLEANAAPNCVGLIT
ncbi:MAG: L-arabinose isomerase, partial [Caldilineae bacterium]